MTEGLDVTLLQPFGHASHGPEAALQFPKNLKLLVKALCFFRTSSKASNLVVDIFRRLEWDGQPGVRCQRGVVSYIGSEDAIA